MRQKGSFWNWYKMMGMIKAFKCSQNLYQDVVCPCPGAIYMFEIVQKCKISLLAQDQLSGERYKTVGPLVLFLPPLVLRYFFFLSLVYFSLKPFGPCKSFGPRQANLVLIAYASSEGSGEPAHPRSLARTFAARSYK